MPDACRAVIEGAVDVSMGIVVTKGHVRAARWRKALPWLLRISITATMLGIGLSGLARWPQPSTKIAEAKVTYAEDIRNAVTAFFDNPADIPTLSRESAAQAPTPEASGVRVADILDTLTGSRFLQSQPDPIMQRIASLVPQAAKTVSHCMRTTVPQRVPSLVSRFMVVSRPARKTRGDAVSVSRAQLPLEEKSSSKGVFMLLRLAFHCAATRCSVASRQSRNPRPFSG